VLSQKLPHSVLLWGGQRLGEPLDKRVQLREHTSSIIACSLFGKPDDLQRHQGAAVAEHGVSFDQPVVAPHRLDESFGDLGSEQLSCANVGAHNHGLSGLCGAGSHTRVRIKLELSDIVDCGTSGEPQFDEAPYIPNRS
jgi:hypothetical protein